MMAGRQTDKHMHTHTKVMKKDSGEEKERKVLTTKCAFRETYWSGYCASCFATTVHIA